MTLKPVLQGGLCVFLALFFFVAGLLHFIKADAFVQIVPPFLPFPKIIVHLTGRCFARKYLYGNGRYSL